MQNLFLTGFGQSDKQFLDLFDSKFTGDNISFKYHSYKNYDDLKKNVIKKHYKGIVGWSLGGQIACRLLADKLITADHLLLISTPFQFVGKYGLNDLVFNSFKLQLMQDFDTALNFLINKIHSSIKLEPNFDTALNFLINKIDSSVKLEPNEDKSNLLSWLDELGNFDCQTLDFSNFPTTIYLAGENDNIVSPKQIDLFRNKIADFADIIIKNCGHAPHYELFKNYE